MKNTLRFLVVSLCLTTAASAQTGSTRPADARTRELYVTVVDQKGVAARGLNPKDFAVREDGATREVLRAVQATEPLDIVLLVDDSQAATSAIPFMRDGLNAFIDRLQGKASIGIVTVGERPTSLVERTSDAAALKKGVGRLFARQGAGAYLLEGVRDVTRGFKTREAARPVIVAVTTEGVEYSNQQFESLIEDVHESGAIFHALAIGTPSPSTSEEMRNRNRLLAEGTTQTGGRREQLLSDMSIPGALTKVADELLNQYLVTYARPEALIPPKRIQVSVTRPGLTARARTRTAGR